jgi:diamine N-acetyltransferase
LRHPFVIRSASEGDNAVLAALGRQTFTETFGPLYPPEDLAAFLEANHTAGRYADWLRDPDVDIWLLEDPAGEAIGYAMLGPCHLPVDALPKGALELWRIYILGTAQGGGRGSALLDTVLARVEARGRPALFLSVYSGNTGAQRLYARAGFRHVGEYLFEVGRQRDREFIWRRD